MCDDVSEVRWPSCFVWPLILLACLAMWAGVGFGVYWVGWGRHSSGPRVVCSKPYETRGATYGTSSIVCEQKP